MTSLWSRRGVLTAACATAAAALAGCGSSTIESALVPSRIISFGDGFSAMGAAGASRYTVNDGSVNIWAQQVASSYGLPLASVADGGTSYARGNARVNNAVDAAGGTAPSIAAQIDAFLATSTFGANDLVLVNGGISDIVYQTQLFVNGTITNEQLLVNVDQAGRDLGAQVQRLVAAGAKSVVVTGAYGMGRSPWAAAIGQAALLNKLSYAGETGAGRPRSFNEALLVTIVNLGGNVLYVDSSFYFNLVTGSPATYAFNDGTTVVCTSTDGGAGIGTGVGEVNSALCNTGTIAAGLDYSKYIFADRVYFTPQAHRLFGTYAFDALRRRF
jgi:outer membrane lipase/esterase